MTLLKSLQARTSPVPIFPRQRMAEVQSPCLGLADPDVGAPAGRDGVGPTDHNVVTLVGCTVMVPVHTGGASGSSFLDAASGETAAGEWSGSRLAVHRDFRGGAWIDTAPLRHAVGMARARASNRSRTDVTVSPVARCAA